MAQEEPKLDIYLTDPKYQKFRDEVDKLEWTGDDPNAIESMSAAAITNRYDEARFAFANVNGNYYPGENTPAGVRVAQAATEARMRNLYQHLRIFERCLEPQDKDSSVLDVPAPDQIMKELSAYRGRVMEMGLPDHPSAAFYIHANHYAEEALRRAEVPEQKISELLGPMHRPVRTALPAAKPQDLDQK